MAKIDEIISTFQSVDESMRLEVLLDYAKKLPELPDDLAAEADSDNALVPECMTPVWLWVRPENGHARIHARVAEEAPTVKGMLSVIIHGYDEASPDELANLPDTMINDLGLSRLIRMNRAVGLGAIIERIRRQARRLKEHAI